MVSEVGLCRPCGRTPFRLTPRILDAAGTDVGPILAGAAATYGLPLLLLVACAKAESGMDPTAFRDNGPADTSVGPYQQTVIYANGYGVGDGTYTPANIAVCRAAFADWTIATRIAAEHLLSDLARALVADPTLAGDEKLLAALAVYNSGHPEPRGNWWWSGPGHANYLAALTWAHSILA